MSAKFFGITECSFCKPVATPSRSLSPSLSFAVSLSNCTFCASFPCRIAFNYLTFLSALAQCLAHSTQQNCNSILCDLLLPHCLPPLFFSSSVSPSPSLFPSHMIMRYSSLRGSSPNCQRHRHRAPLWTPQKPLKLRAA